MSSSEPATDPSAVRPRRVAVAGASGLIGSALVARLRERGDDVVRLVRRQADAPDEVRWDPQGGTVDVAALGRDGGPDAVVNLAGAGVGDHRWSDAYKREIRESRVRGTDTLARALLTLERPPEVLVSASAIGIYGDTGDTPVDESAPAGTGFLAGVVEAWERAADPAREGGIRVAHPRTGLVWTRAGGAVGRQLPLFRLMLGGRLGSGRQYWSVISLQDEVSALLHLIARDDLAGPVNLTAPHPVTNAEATRALAAAVGRPAVLPVPAFALRAALGEFATDVLTSARVVPAVLTASGFSWAHPSIDDVARYAVQK